MTCKDCLYYEVCPLGLAIQGKTGTCLKFKNKADFVEVVRCKDCKYSEKGVTEYGITDYICRKLNRNYIKIAITNLRENDFCSYGERAVNYESSKTEKR